MGLLLSILVVCVGVLEAVSCFRHIQHGYLPFWMPRRQPTLPERRRRKPSDASSSSDEELSLLMTHDVMLSPPRTEPHYGLTPILAEHRRNTPILRDDEDEEGDAKEAVDKYVANNVDDCLVQRCDGTRSSEVIERFRPISPTDSRQDGASEVSGASDALGSARLAAETDERCDSEVTLSGDLENDPDVVSEVEPPVVDAPLELLELLEPLEPVALLEPATLDPPIVETKADTIETKMATRETNETTSDADTTTSSDHPEPVKRPDELPAAPPPNASVVHPLDGPLSRPSTPSTPRKVRADISWPVFRPDEPVIKRPSTELGRALRLSLSQDDSIDEDLLDAELEGITATEAVAPTQGKDDVEDKAEASQPERVVELPIKPTLDMFLESLERLDKSMEAKDIDEPVERMENTFDASHGGAENTSSQRPDLDMLLDGLNAMSGISPNISLPAEGGNAETHQNSELFHLDSLLSSTSSHIPDLPEIPDRPASPKVSFLDQEIQIVDDHFSQTVAEEPIELSTSFVDIQAIPPSHPTTRAQDFETPRGRAMVDAFGRIVGVETDEEVARRLEALIEPKDVETIRSVERAFDKKLSSDTERLVSLKDIFEPECKKVTAFCVAVVQGTVDNEPIEEDTSITRPAVEEDVCEIKNDSYSALGAAELPKTAEDIKEFIETAKLVDPPAFESEIISKQTTDSLDLQSHSIPDPPIDADPSLDASKPLKDVVAKEPDAILETTADVDQQTNENASEFEPTVTLAAEPEIDPDSVATIASKVDVDVTKEDLICNLQETLEYPNNEVESQITLESNVIATSLAVQPSSVEESSNVAEPETTSICIDMTTSQTGINVDFTSVSTQPSIEVDKVEDDDVGGESESLALCKDITSKESSIKRRKSYKKRSPRTSTESLTGGDDHAQSKERRRELTASREATMMEEDAGIGPQSLQDSATNGAQMTTKLNVSLEGSISTKSGKLTELSPREEVKLEYASPEDSDKHKDWMNVQDPNSETLSRSGQRTSPRPAEEVVEESATPREEQVAESTSNKVSQYVETSTEESPLKNIAKSLELTLKEDPTHLNTASKSATALATSTPNEDRALEVPTSKPCVKLTELSPSEEVQLAYIPPNLVYDVPARNESPSPPPPTHRRESAAEAISNNALLPVEVLHVDVGVVKEAAVFATTTKEQGKKLKRPARAESFEEAVVDVRLKGRLTKRGQDGETDGERDSNDDSCLGRSDEIRKVTGQTSEDHGDVQREGGELEDGQSEVREIDGKSGGGSGREGAATSKGLEFRVVDRKCTDPEVVAGSGGGGSESIESNPNVVEGDDEEEESVSTAGEVKHPTQTSNPAFWLIFSGEYTKAMSKDWHSGHFCCWQCDESLTGQRYVLRDDHPYCIKCYESVFANMCEECSKTIGIDSKDLSYKDKHWHEACFLCNKCRVSLVDKQFGSKADKIYCGNCYDSQFASRCDGCGEIFRAGTKKMEYKTRQWHEKCFCCCVCKSAIGTKSFIPREQEIYCATCYEEKFATRCVKCNKIITSGGVTYKNEPWHRECFTCTHCSASLAGQRFTSRDEKPYCADCFGELFAKRCTACVKPITGIGGTRFISFEDRHWHNDCFICASCKTSLVGRGFITDADDIICPECAKQKLM